MDCLIDNSEQNFTVNKIHVFHRHIFSPSFGSQALNQFNETCLSELKNEGKSLHIWWEPLGKWAKSNSIFVKLSHPPALT